MDRSLAANAALTSLALADALYHRYYGDVLSVSSLREIRQFYRMRPSLRPLLRRTDLLLALDVVCGLLLLPWYSAKPVEDLALEPFFRMLAALGVVDDDRALRSTIEIETAVSDASSRQRSSWQSLVF